MVENVEMLKERAEDESKKKSKYSRHLDEFLATDNQTMRIRFTDDYEARKCANSYRATNKNKNLNIVVWQKGCEVVVIKG